MRRHSYLQISACLTILLASMAMGCRGTQYARVIQPGQREMIGSHQAGQETYEPLIDEAVGKLLARHMNQEHMQVSMQLPAPPMRICFVGVENKTAEEIGDFKEQIYESIDSRLLEAGGCNSISRRYVEAGLRESRLRPDELFLPSNMELFASMLEQQGQPFDFLLFAKLTSGTTRQNKNYQRDYLLTLELIDVRTGEQDKQSATLSKGYHQSWASRTFSQAWPFGAR